MSQTRIRGHIGNIPVILWQDADTAPASDWFAITPDDDSDLVRIPRAIEASTGGAVVIRSEQGAQVTVTLIAGVPKPVSPKRILASGTTAAGLVGYI